MRLPMNPGFGEPDPCPRELFTHMRKKFAWSFAWSRCAVQELWRRATAIFVFAAILFPAGAAESLSAEQAAAKKIYLKKCAKCHELYDPKAYSDTEWNSWMTKMRKKSKLTPDQYQLLLRYTEIVREDKMSRTRKK